ncbi:MAG: hypothetical protein NTX44_02655 [Ignavibacteriales bacterium]|nr:hypothetical protein [Ignavibacteriales bacterium]
MKKLFAVLVVIALVASVASAQAVWGQGKMSAGVGAELGLPMGTWGDFVGVGIGGFGLFQYGINEDILATGQVGYTSWAKKNDISSGSSLEILVGGKYNLSKSVTPGFYGELQLGIYSVSTTVSFPGSPAVIFGGVTIVPASGAQDITGTESRFVFIPGVGYQFGPIDASVKYVLSGDVGNLALNVAYIFPL